jgi:hypothetical protein
MRLIGFAAAAIAAPALAGCGGGGGNDSNNQINTIEAEGVPDINSAVSGDELAPIPEASDDMVINNAVVPSPANAAAPAPANAAAPAPAPR